VIWRIVAAFMMAFKLAFGLEEPLPQGYYSHYEEG
jgi:hypothetical protein